MERKNDNSANTLPDKKRLLLASSSPRRKEILEKENIRFTIEKSHYIEDGFEIYDESFLKQISLYKALDVAKHINYAATVIGADTIVILDSVCLLKPACYSKAFSLLKKLSGKTHSVITSISLVDCETQKYLTEILETKVTFRTLSDDEIENYIKKYNPLDKAGSYGIQDFLTPETIKNPPKSSFITKIQGDYYNVMGISPIKLKDMLKRFY